MVLNYNGLVHLDDCFRTLLQAASRSQATCTVVCVDNRSTDQSVPMLAERFPDVEIVVAERNDYLFSLNEVVARREEDIVVILNNDMRFDPNFVDPLLAHFRRDDVFAVNARILEWDASGTQNGPRRARIDRLWMYKWWDAQLEATAHTIEAGGGASAYHRQRFVELGGFDPLYRPGYYEDFDLSYRAWERGWTSVYEPASRIFHRQGATMTSQLGNDRLAVLVFRNHVLCTIKNVGDWGFTALFLFLLPIRALRPLLRGDSIPWRASLAAGWRIPLAIVQRARKRGFRQPFADIAAAVGRPVPQASEADIVLGA